VAGRRVTSVGLAASVCLAMVASALAVQPADGARARAPASTRAVAARDTRPANNAATANNAPLAKSHLPTKAYQAKASARAPSEPPLGAKTGLSPEAEASASASPSGGDPLVDNGLGSPLCGDSTRAELSPAGQRNCGSSDFDAALAPTGDYAFDVHIDTGVTNAGNYLSEVVQNSAQWGWMLLVAIVHGVIVMLEWCYTVDLLNGSAMQAVTNKLSETQAAFTRPWLVLALAVAAMLALYHGIVRRQVSETLGQVVLMGAMMLGGFWVIVNPLGTVGVLGAWAGEASLGTLGAVVAGTPKAPDRTLAESMESVFSGTIGGPWCYLEFGDVRWCESKHVDPRLAAAAHGIATVQRAKIGSQSAELLSAARTNGQLFLALAANGPQRNSINDRGSLFNALCGGSEEPCRGPTAGEAEFRTQHGTTARVIGLFLIWIGVLGMVLLLGYLALHLLGAAIASLFLLLLAPAAVIVPALGDGGRSLFRRWGTWLLGAVCSKLIFSFLLGVVLLMQRTLMDLAMFGWWAQWLLVSAMWWGAFLKRHHVLGFVDGQHRSGHAPGSLSRHVRRAREKLHHPPPLAPGAKWVKGKLSASPPSVGRRQRLAQAGRARAQAVADRQVRRTLEHEHAEARTLKQAGPQTRARISAKQAQLKRVRQRRETALARGDRRKAAELAVRAQRIEGQVAREQTAFDAARKTADQGERSRRRTGGAYTREQGEERARLLDAQAALPAGGRRGGAGGNERRDYAALAGLAGYGRSEYAGLDRRRQREARLEIDRELAVRKELSVSHELPSSLTPKPKRRGFGTHPRDRREISRSTGAKAKASSAGESSVMRDAHEVAARRKRQLGRERR
jgi:hypothetical protein